MKFMSANRIAPDGTPHYAASHLGLFCLHMSHRKNAMLIWVKQKEFIDGVLQFQTGQKLSLKLTYAYHTQE